MKREKIMLFMIFFLFLITSSVLIFAGSDGIMTVEANITGFANESNVSDVSIWVPDYISLGEITKESPVSEEIKIYVNNTGKLPITVTPQLKNIDETIFSYLFFRKQKTTSTNNTDLVKFFKIGNYSLDISKPAAGKSYSYETCYMQLNLTDFDGEIKEDLIGYKSDIVFIAMPQ